MEVVSEFLVSRYGPEDETTAEVLRRAGVVLGSEAQLRRRAMLGSVRGAIDSHPRILLERLLALGKEMAGEQLDALFNSQLFYHILVKMVEDEGAKGARDICSKYICVNSFKMNNDLHQFVRSLESVVEDSTGLDGSDRLGEHRLPDVVFRRDLRRAIWALELNVLGRTKLETTFPEPTWPVVYVKPGQTALNIIVDTTIPSTLQDLVRVPRPSPRNEEDSFIETTTIQSTLATAPLPQPQIEENSTVKTTTIPAVLPEIAIALPPIPLIKKAMGGGRWTRQEVDALLEGYERYKHESRVWKKILNAYPDVLGNRTNVNIKDKHRNLMKKTAQQE